MSWSWLSGLFKPVTEQLEEVAEMVLDHLKRLAVATGLLKLGLFFLALGGLFVLIALFLALSAEPLRANAGLITGLVAVALGAIVTAISVRLFKR